MYIATTIGIILILIVIINFITEDMAIRISCLKYDADYKETRRDYMQEKKLKRKEFWNRLWKRKKNKK